MFCGKCGKEMSSTEKFCPNCGAPNPNAGAKPAVPRPVAGGKPAMPSALAGKSMYRISLIVLGAVHVLIYFFVSYGEMADRMTRELASYFGLNMPDRLTGPGAIKIYKQLADYGVTNAKENYWTLLLIFGLPLVMGVLVLVLNLLNNTKKSYTLSIIFTVLSLLSYLVVLLLFPIFEDDLMVTTNASIYFVLVITVVQLVVSILGRSKDKTIVTAG